MTEDQFKKLSGQLAWANAWLFWITLLAGFLVGRLVASASPIDSRLPSHERVILSGVARKYGLSAEQRKLLFVIRLVENGSNGKEMGVLVPSAQRYRHNPDKSLHCQAQWAAGSVKKRFTGDIEKFARRWCPNTPKHPKQCETWIRNATYWMRKGEK